MEPFDNECSKSCDQENRNQVVITVPIIENPPVRAKYAEVQNSQKSDGDNDVAEPNQYTRTVIAVGLIVLFLVGIKHLSDFRSNYLAFGNYFLIGIDIPESRGNVIR